MPQRVIDGDRWIAQRLAFLRELAKTDVSPEQQQAIEAEIQSLSQERGIQQGGRRRTRWSLRRRLFGRRRRGSGGGPADSR